MKSKITVDFPLNFVSSSVVIRFSWTIGQKHWDRLPHCPLPEPAAKTSTTLRSWSCSSPWRLFPCPPPLWSYLVYLIVYCHPSTSRQKSNVHGRCGQAFGLVWIWEHFAWFCYCVPRLLVVWFVGMLWWRKTDDWRRTSSVPGQEPKLQDGHLQQTRHSAPSLPCSQPLFYFVPLSDSMSCLCDSL